jgi:hydrogenase small subunit
VLSLEVGEDFIHPFEMAQNGELDAPYVCIYEGSIADERIAGATGGYFSAMGDQVMDNDEDQPFPTASRLKVMAERAAAVIAIGTCATWGGIPAATGNPTGAMSVMDFLGRTIAARSASRSSTFPAVLRWEITSPRP